MAWLKDVDVLRTQKGARIALWSSVVGISAVLGLSLSGVWTSAATVGLHPKPAHSAAVVSRRVEPPSSIPSVDASVGSEPRLDSGLSDDGRLLSRPWRGRFPATLRAPMGMEILRCR